MPFAEAEGQAMDDTLQYALENNRSEVSSDWVNPGTGRSAAVTPIRTFQGAKGEPCREFVTTIIIDGRDEQGYGTACRQPDGHWEVVNDESGGDRTPPTPSQLYVVTPAERYYNYPSGFYGTNQIYLSFGTVYRSGHRYRGSVYLDGRTFYKRHPRPIRDRVWVGRFRYDHYRRFGDRDDYRRYDDRSRFRERLDRREDRFRDRRRDDDRRYDGRQGRGRD